MLTHYLTAALFVSGTFGAVSTSGQCGNVGNQQLTCQGSTFGNCCSQYGWCGSTQGHCGDGCQSGFGTCGSGAGPSGTSTIPSSTTAQPVGSSTTPAPSSSATAAIPDGTPQKICNGKSDSQVVTNPSFEQGATGWTIQGNAKVLDNGADKTFYQNGFDGKKFMQLQVNSTNPTGTSISQSVSVGSFLVTLSFDWNFSVLSHSRGPPSIDCSLGVTWSDGFYSLGGWTRRASSGGKGHYEETFETGTSGGPMKFAFSCDNAKWNGMQYEAGLVLDNIQAKWC